MPAPLESELLFSMQMAAVPLDGRLHLGGNPCLFNLNGTKKYLSFHLVIADSQNMTYSGLVTSSRDSSPGGLEANCRSFNYFTVKVMSCALMKAEWQELNPQSVFVYLSGT